MPRPICTRCGKPRTVCLCASLVCQTNTFPILILRHPDEVKKALNTAPLVALGLSDVRIMDGLKFSEQALLSWLASMGKNKPVLLYPKALNRANSHFIIGDEKVNSCVPITAQIDSIIVLDGSWRNTREMLLTNDWLSSLNTMSVSVSERSAYKIRKSDVPNSLSTIEALAYALDKLDSNFCITSFLRPFHYMIDQQIRHMGSEVYKKNYGVDQG